MISRAGARPACARPFPAPHPPPLPRPTLKMKTAPVVALVEDVKGQFNHVAEALAHVAEQLKQSYASMRMAYYRSRRGRALAHGAMNLTPQKQTILVSVTQAFSLNSVALRVLQIRDLIKRKWDVPVSHQRVTCFVRRHR